MHDGQSEHTTQKEQVKNPELFKKYFVDIGAWAQDNARTIIKVIAGFGGFAATASLLLYLSSTALLHEVAASDVSGHLEALQTSGKYIEEIQDVPESIRGASVAFSIDPQPTYSHGTCSGTVLQKIEVNEIDNIYTMITAQHCLKDKNGEINAVRGRTVWIGASPDGSSSETTEGNYSVKQYVPIPETDIAFLVFQGTIFSKDSFAPLGPGSLKVFDPQQDDSLSGLSYPYITEGWPVPIVDLTIRDEKLQDYGNYEIPVDSFPFSLAASGAGLANEDEALVALASGLTYEWWQPHISKRTLIAPITQNVIDAYQNLLEDLGVKE